jgi:hypothetical protein
MGTRERIQGGTRGTGGTSVPRKARSSHVSFLSHRAHSDADDQPLIALAASLQDALHQKLAHYAPIARQLILSRSTDVREIEHTLDHLLDVACLPAGLAPFKALCRYYYAINPAATATYVYAYREMWDSEETPEQELEL